MPSSKSLNKAARSAERKRLQNRSIRSSVKTHITKAEKLIDAKGESAHQETVIAISTIDKAVSKGVLHRNKGARLKSRAMKKLNDTIAVGPSPEPSKRKAKKPQREEG
jgi:small subunit ribosomal protein S20